MKLSDMIKNVNATPQAQKILVYGHAKTGKTFFAAGAAKSPKIKRIVWFDFEGGAGTLLNPALKLTPAEQDKIEVISVYDDEDHPYAIETALQILHPQRQKTICAEHGRFSCALCKSGAEATATHVDVPTFDSSTLVVLDSLSAVTDSAFNYAKKMVGKSDKFAIYGMQGDLLKVIMTAIQHAQCHVVCLTHVAVGKDDATDKETVAPLCGTRAFSLQVGRYFDHVVYKTIELKKFKAGSTPTYKVNTVSGSRTGVALEKDAESTICAFF